MKGTLTVLAIALAVAAPFALTSCSDGDGERSPAESMRTERSTESPEAADAGAARGMAAGDVGTEEGQYPPPFVLPDLEGVEHSLDDFAGKVVILDLWATWCPPCRAEIPALIELQNEYGERGLEVVGVGLDQGGAKVLAPFLEEYGVNYTILAGNREVQQRYRVNAIPTTFFIARDGRIASKHVGFHPDMLEGMKEEIEALLEGRRDEA